MLHDVEATVFERRGQELASASDVFCFGRCGEELGEPMPGSPIMAANDPEERVTIFMVWVGKWSDGTPAPGWRTEVSKFDLRMNKAEAVIAASAFVPLFLSKFPTLQLSFQSSPTNP